MWRGRRRGDREERGERRSGTERPGRERACETPEGGEEKESEGRGEKQCVT